jgi:hypothetical protein
MGGDPNAENDKDSTDDEEEILALKKKDESTENWKLVKHIPKDLGDW